MLERNYIKNNEYYAIKSDALTVKKIKYFKFHNILYAYYF